MKGVVRHLEHEGAGRKVWCPALVSDARVGARASSPRSGGRSSGPGAGLGRMPDTRFVDLEVSKDAPQPQAMCCHRRPSPFIINFRQARLCLKLIMKGVVRHPEHEEPGRRLGVRCSSRTPASGPGLRPPERGGGALVPARA